MGRYEDYDRVRDYIKNMNTGGYFRILYVYVDGEYGYFNIRIELEKLPGWEGYYEDHIYKDELYRLEWRIKDDVVSYLGFHRPRVDFRIV